MNPSNIVAKCDHVMVPSNRITGFLECPKCHLAMLAPGPELDRINLSRAAWFRGERPELAELEKK